MEFNEGDGMKEYGNCEMAIENTSASKV